MDDRELRQVIGHLKGALAVLERHVKARKPSRNPMWFRETGHLSDDGIRHLQSLFSKGLSSYSIAKEMHMSYRAVSLRHDAWRKKNPSPAAWMRQDSK